VLLTYAFKISKDRNAGGSNRPPYSYRCRKHCVPHRQQSAQMPKKRSLWMLKNTASNVNKIGRLVHYFWQLVQLAESRKTATAPEMDTTHHLFTYHPRIKLEPFKKLVQY
jgi:hypothetical protein